MPHHIPPQKWLISKDLAELCVTLTYIRVCWQVNTFTHSTQPQQCRLYAVEPTCFGRQPYQLMK